MRSQHHPESFTSSIIEQYLARIKSDASLINGYFAPIARALYPLYISFISALVCAPNNISCISAILLIAVYEVKRDNYSFIRALLISWLSFKAEIISFCHRHLKTHLHRIDSIGSCNCWDHPHFLSQNSGEQCKLPFCKNDDTICAVTMTNDTTISGQVM